MMAAVRVTGSGDGCDNWDEGSSNDRGSDDGG
jgi:hypothetical protein